LKRTLFSIFTVVDWFAGIGSLVKRKGAAFWWGPRTKKVFKNITFSKNISKKPHQELVRYKQ
jgi:hypothetical protein